MGFNGTYLGVDASRPDVVPRLPRVVEEYFRAQGSELVARGRALTLDSWRRDPSLVGVAIGPPVESDGERWVAIADSARTPSRALAATLAAALDTPVVMSSIYEICDPPEPEVVEVFGGPMSDRFRGLFMLIAGRYPLGRDATLLTFRGPGPHAHGDECSSPPCDGDEIPF